MIEIQVPGDKSISHRALIFGAIAHGETRIRGLSPGQDVLSTRRCLEQLGVQFDPVSGREWIVKGRGREGLLPPQQPLDCGNSGTTLRLLTGLLAGQPFPSRLTGDASLIRRPMRRVTEYLRQMGAQITLSEHGTAPLEIQGISPENRLKGTCHFLTVPSAQVKSALLLAGMFAEGETTLQGMLNSRDHSERMLPYFGVPLQILSFKQCDRWNQPKVPRVEEIRIRGPVIPQGVQIQVPGDPSSAAFWIGAACIVPGLEVKIPSVSLNPTRLGFVRVLKRMGAQIKVETPEVENLDAETPMDLPGEFTQPSEPQGSLRACYSSLHATRIEPSEIPDLLDEIPILAVVATQAQGQTEICGASELRVKESDRIEAILSGLRNIGVNVTSEGDTLRINGPQVFRGGQVNSFDDHRIAMAFSIAGLISQKPVAISGKDCVQISYPEFYQVLENLARTLARTLE